MANGNIAAEVIMTLIKTVCDLRKMSALWTVSGRSRKDCAQTAVNVMAQHKILSKHPEEAMGQFPQSSQLKSCLDSHNGVLLSGRRSHIA
jgi:hypothetical protein